jgi:hypothetical protein
MMAMDLVIGVEGERFRILNGRDANRESREMTRMRKPLFTRVSPWSA